MKENHLRLVVSNTMCYERKAFSLPCINLFKKMLRNVFISEREKIYILKDFLIKIYRDYENTTGIADVPYYIRAEIKIKRIIREKKVNHYYKLYEKFNRDNLI